MFLDILQHCTTGWMKFAKSAVLISWSMFLKMDDYLANYFQAKKVLETNPTRVV